MIQLRRRGRYTGRLAFDPDSGFHVDPKGRRVLTEDEGKTWRYARRGDTSHFARYHQRFVVVDGTANADNPGSHHFNVLPNDPHVAGLVFHPDAIAPTTTSHTESYR